MRRADIHVDELGIVLQQLRPVIRPFRKGRQLLVGFSLDIFLLFDEELVEILLLRLRPKKIYKTNPRIGMKNSTISQAQVYPASLRSMNRKPRARIMLMRVTTVVRLANSMLFPLSSLSLSAA